MSIVRSSWVEAQLGEWRGSYVKAEGVSERDAAARARAGMGGRNGSRPWETIICSLLFVERLRPADTRNFMARGTWVLTERRGRAREGGGDGEGGRGGRKTKNKRIVK
ncbi:hypothetical protein E2C01_099225 [Portunus trituberculatus]|uniref:Uncharacterized protein n=1 Tax=Portunus trituberculatus TaxID=210409 RepID=A0A5B7KAA1_PORTR|nr:hypothetical protein [Portunus trituberculatus]